MTTYKIIEPSPTEPKWICTVTDAKGIVAYVRRDSEEDAISFGSTLILKKIKSRVYDKH